MAVTSKVLFRGAAATTSTTLYTTPATATAVVTNIGVTNTTTSAVTASILLDDVAILSSVAVDARTTIFVDLKQVVDASDTIKGSASTTAVNFHISGVEII
jgi:hypothetical protein